MKMIFTLLKLSRKESFRSRFRNKSIFINILLGFFALYFAAIFVAAGLLLPEILKDIGIETDPMKYVNSVVIIYLLIDLIMRFTAQSLPVVSVKHFLHLNIKKPDLVNYLLIKSKFSGFNFLPLLFIIPFAIMTKESNYSTSEIVVWVITMLLLLMINNYLNFIIKKTFGDKSYYLLSLIAVVAVFAALNYYNIISVTEYFGLFIEKTMQYPVLLILPLVLIVLLYYLNYNYLLSKLTLDDLVKNKTDIVAANDMSWADSFGDIAPYIKVDLRMIWRNKRPRTVLYMSFALLLYGLMFYTNPIYKERPVFLIFVAVFITGIFAINFGQFIPSWDSAHYSMLMTQRTNLLTYVKSKFAIMAFSVIIFFILSTPYVYFGWEILLMHFAAALYNIGGNIMILLLFSSYNNKPIDLGRGAVMNYQGTGVKQWVMVIPILLIPVLIFWIGDMLYGFYGSIALLSTIGVLGIIFHQKLIFLVAQQLADRKHKIIESFKENS